MTGTCPACGAPHPSWRPECAHCGVRFGAPCASCGSLNLERARFCTNCGDRLADAPSIAPTRDAPDRGEAERRRLTVLFCDVVGSTELASRLDPEELRDVLTVYQRAAASVVGRFEGHIAQYLGDGLLIYFGHPAAHEDDAQRAARAALSMLAAFQRVNARLESEYGVRLQVRIGIHSGLVVLGEIGAGHHVELLALGETPNVAARLQGLARPDTVLVSAATHALIEGYFECAELGPHVVRGLGQPMSVWQVLHESTARSRLDVAAAGGLTPLIGREREVQALLDTWGAAERGEGRIVLISGEPGIGKSRLARVLEEHVAQNPTAWLTVAMCSPYYRNTAFYPIVDLIERVALEFTTSTTPEQKLDRLTGWLTQFDLDRPDVVPLFAGLLSIPLGDRYPPLTLPPERQKLDLMERLLDIFFARADEQPVLLVIEDVHWADPSTLELLELAVNRVPGTRVLTLLTFRPEFVPTWTEHEYETELMLARLGPDDAAQLVGHVSAGQALPSEILEQVIVRTDGVPLFVEELTKTVLQSGLLRSEGDGFELAGPLPPLAIPTTLHDSLMARLDRLQPVKGVAQLAATVGREFSFELLAAVSALDADTLRASLDQLVKAELLYERGSAPNSTYVFKHALIQEAAYQALLRSTRQQYHQQIARVLEERFPMIAEAQPELLAQHYTQAGLAERAIPYWEVAGQRALGRAANLEAIAHLTRGVELVLTLPPGTHRDRKELAMQTQLAPAYMAIKGWASVEVEATARRARELSEALGNPGGVFASLWGLWTNSFLRCELEPALDIARQVLAIAEATDLPVFHVTARHATGYSHFYRGEFELARAHAEAGLAHFDIETEAEIVRAFQFSSSAALRMMLGCSLWMLGDVDAAPSLVDGAVALTRELGHKPSEAYALAASLLFHHYRRDVQRAYDTANTLLTLAREESFEIWSPFALMFQGWATVERSRAAAGIAELRRGIDLWQATGNALNQTIAMTMLAECLWKDRQEDEALAILTEEIPAATARHEGHYLSEVYRVKAEILASAMNRPEEAEPLLEQALELTRSAGARMLELRTAVSLGRLWEQTGRAGGVPGLVQPRLDALPAGVTGHDIDAARTLLTGVGGGRASASQRRSQANTWTA